MVRVRQALVALIVAIAMAITVLPVSGVAQADTVDGVADGVGRLPVGEVFDLAVLGRGGVPAAGVGSVALNVTVTNPFGSGFVTVWPAGRQRPTASSLNFVRAQTVPNMVIVPVGDGGKVSLFVSGGSADVVVDVLGWFPTGGGFTGLTPARLLDSRAGGVTVDGAQQATGALRGGATFDLAVRGRGGVPVSGAGAVVLNVTLVEATDPTFLTVWPAGTTRPTASNLNVARGETRPNLVVVPLGTVGDVSLYLYSGSADVVVDVLGWFPTAGAFTGVSPARLMDSRSDGLTVDGGMRATGAMTGGTPVELPVAGRGGVPVAATSVVLNVTVTSPTEPAFLTVYPKGRPRPNASNVNVLTGQTTPNAVMVPLGAGGEVELYLNRGRANVVVDLLGYVTGTDVFVGVTPARLLETRGASSYVPLPLGQTPSRLVSGGTGLWTLTAAGELIRIDTASGVTEMVDVPGRNLASQALFDDGRFLWMRGDGERRILRFDPATRRTASFVLPFGMSGDERPVFDGRHLWYGNRFAITRVDQLSGAMRVYQVPQTLLQGVSDSVPFAGVVFDGRYLWFGARLFGGDLGRLDTTTGRFDAVPLPAGYRVIGPTPPLVSDGERVWTVAFFVGPAGERKALVWFDARTGTSGTIELPPEVWAADVMFADGTSMWITSTWVDRVAKVNLSTGVTTLFDGETLVDPRGAIAGPDRLLVSATDGVSVWAVATVSGVLARFPRGL